MQINYPPGRHERERREHEKPSGCFVSRRSLTYLPSRSCYPRIFLIAIGVFFPIYLNTFYGIRQVDRGLIEMAQSYGLTRSQLLGDVILPGALPSILVGLRYTLGVMWLTLIIAETIAASSGIGLMTTEAREFMQTDVMMLSIILYAVFGKLADLIARGLERRLLRWHPNYQTV